jgi:hypothetical protein
VEILSAIKLPIVAAAAKRPSTDPFLGLVLIQRCDGWSPAFSPFPRFTGELTKLCSFGPSGAQSDLSLIGRSDIGGFYRLKDCANYTWKDDHFLGMNSVPFNTVRAEPPNNGSAL